MQRRVLLHFAQKIFEHQKGQRPVRCTPRRPQQRTRSARVAESSVPTAQQSLACLLFLKFSEDKS
jgi:hypothetical protein